MKTIILAALCLAGCADWAPTPPVQYAPGMVQQQPVYVPAPYYPPAAYAQRPTYYPPAYNNGYQQPCPPRRVVVIPAPPPAVYVGAPRVGGGVVVGYQGTIPSPGRRFHR